VAGNRVCRAPRGGDQPQSSRRTLALLGVTVTLLALANAATPQAVVLEVGGPPVTLPPGDVLLPINGAGEVYTVSRAASSSVVAGVPASRSYDSRD